MDLSTPFIHMYHIIPIAILFFRAVTGDMGPAPMLFPAEHELPILDPLTTGSSGIKEARMEHIDKIYGLNVTNTLYPAHTHPVISTW